MKICLACSGGGHLREIMQLKSIYIQYDPIFVTVREKQSEELTHKTYFIEDINRKALSFLINFVKSLKILLKEEPDVIITTGAGTALPLCYLAKLFRKKIIFIESFSRVTTKSLFGKFVAPISDLIIVQWKPLLNQYKKAVYGGPIFNSQPAMKEQGGKYLFIMTGTTIFGFDRLLNEVDKLIESKVINEKVIAQIGRSKYKPKNCEYVDFLTPDEVSELMSKSSVVITHGGVGSIMDALVTGKPTIVVPRYKKFNECVDNHQLEITQELEKEGMIIPVYDISKLSEALRKAETFKSKNFTLSESNVKNIIKNYLKDSFRENVNNGKEHANRW